MASKKGKIVMGGDHAGFEYKQQIIEFIESNGWEVEDKGTKSLDSCDYPDYIHPVAQEVKEGTATFGVIVCGSGNGVAMTANKYPDVRAALAWKTEIAELARLHNDANILSIPARYVAIDEAKEMVNTFLSTEFEGGRHQRRVDKINLK